MKKTGSFLLALFLILQLCACDLNNDRNRDWDNDDDDRDDELIEERETADESSQSLKEKLSGNIGIITVNGEECYALWGETVALVWKYVEATFETDAHVLSATAIDIAKVASSNEMYVKDGWDALRISPWSTWNGWTSFTPKHIGDDMFMFAGYLYEGIAETYFEFYIDAIGFKVLDLPVVFEDERDSFYRWTEFSDDYAVGIYYDYTSSTKFTSYLAIIDKQLNVTISDIVVYNNYNSTQIGKYSDGLFYYNRQFYNLDFDLVLDTQDEDWGGVYQDDTVYAPYFKDGVCKMITFKNGKYWIFEIDKSGNIITEAKEFDLSQLNH